MKRRFFKSVVFVLFLSFSYDALANIVYNFGHKRSFDLPIWVTTIKKKVHGRVGPGKRYPIKQVYETPFLPFKILAEVGEWLKLKDFEGDEVWVHKTMVSRKAPAFLVTLPCSFYAKYDADNAYATLQPSSVLRVRRCEGSRCEGFIREFEGWFDPIACGGFGATPGIEI